MKKLHLFILKSFLGPFIVTLLVVSFIFLMFFVFRWLDDFITKNPGFDVILELVVYNILFYALPLALPVSMLLASLITFGNLGEFSELTAIKSAGISLWGMMRSLIIFTVLFAIFTFFYMNTVVPFAYLKQVTILYSINSKNPDIILKKGIFNDDIGEMSIRYMRQNSDTRMLYDMMIFDKSEGLDYQSVTVADSGEFRLSDDKLYAILTLYSGKTYSPQKEEGQDKKYPLNIQEFRKNIVSQSVEGLNFQKQSESLFKNQYRARGFLYLDSSVVAMNKKVDALALKESDVFLISKGLISKNILSHHRHSTPETFPIAWEKLKKRQKIKVLMEAQDKPEIIDSLLVKTSKYNSFETPYEPLNFDSLYASLSGKEQLKVLEGGKEDAKRSKDNFSRSSNTIKNTHENSLKYAIEYHRKFALAISCLVFFFVGAPFGAIIRKGGFAIPMIISVLVFLAYYVLSTVLEDIATTGGLSPVLAMWIPSMVFAPLGLFFAYKASKDYTL